LVPGVSWNGTQAAVEAVRARGLADRVRVLGTDLSPTLETMLRDRDGILLAVTAQRPEEMGYRAAPPPWRPSGERTYEAGKTASSSTGCLCGRGDPERSCGELKGRSWGAR
jgi:hypothetical protein